MPRCDHAAFRVADLDRSVAFYEAVLPARLVSRRRHDDRWRTEIATLRPEGQDDFSLVLLMPHRAAWLLRLFHAFVPRQTRSHEHLGFVCDSREELGRRLEAARRAGARIENLPQPVGEGGGCVLEVLDPDGNAVEWTFGVVHD
jgi:catechol 2,3-dioxygenase-like lactoylglutathione lyase family enzyme